MWCFEKVACVVFTATQDHLCKPQRKWIECLMERKSKSHLQEWVRTVEMWASHQIGVNKMPFCFWVTHAHRKTDRGRRSPSSCARMTQSVCCLSARSRSLKDSVTPTSLGFTTRWNVTRSRIRLYSPRPHTSTPVPPFARLSAWSDPLLPLSWWFTTPDCLLNMLLCLTARGRGWLGAGVRGGKASLVVWHNGGRKSHKTQEQWKKWKCKST